MSFIIVFLPLHSVEVLSHVFCLFVCLGFCFCFLFFYLSIFYLLSMSFFFFFSPLLCYKHSVHLTLPIRAVMVNSSSSIILALATKQI